MKHYGYAGLNKVMPWHLMHTVNDKNGYTAVYCESATMAKRIARLLNKDIEAKNKKWATTLEVES